MMIMSDLQKRILKEEYPTISFDSDPDVERYFDLRSVGRQSDALQLYNSKIVQKYPDPDNRALLMRLYRSKDYAYKEILADSLVLLANRVIDKTRKIISIISHDIDELNLHDAYSVIKHAEGLLSIISPDRYQSIAFAEKYVRLAKMLDFRFPQMEKTSELIRLYVTDNLVVLHEFRENKERTKKDKKKADDSGNRAKPSIDLSKIEFDPADVAKICIPVHITKTEDIVIAYCLKYWNSVNNSAFEKTIFLYSRKYKTTQYDVFQAIKNGRTHGWKDEEILNAVLSTVVSGYYYNISGDLYLQRTWALYKNKISLENSASSNAFNLQKNISAERKKTAAKKRIKRIRLTSEERVTSIVKEKKSEKPKQRVKNSEIKSLAAFKKSSASKQIEIPKHPERIILIPNSIADIIRKKTGKTYAVYKELFFRGIRPSIRSILASASVKKGLVFNGKQNDAEEIIYKFLYDHYSDPYQNWKESNERKRVEDLGYYMPEIESVIEGWIQNNR